MKTTIVRSGALAIVSIFSLNASAEDFRSFPSPFPTERVVVPSENITCSLQETAAPPGGSPGVRAVVTVSGYFVSSDGTKHEIDAQRPLTASLLNRTMARASRCEGFLREVQVGEVTVLRQGETLQMTTRLHNALGLR